MSFAPGLAPFVCCNVFVSLQQLVINRQIVLKKISKRNICKYHN